MEVRFPLITERLLIRPVEMTDADALFKYRSDRKSNKYQGWIPETLQDAKDFINTAISNKIDIPDTWFQLVIIIRSGSIMIGDIGIHFLNSDNCQVEIGYTLDKNYQHKGYATEGLNVIIDFLFNILNKHRITASIDPRNKSSISLVKRMGFRKEAHFRESSLIRNEWTDDLVYAILKKDWKKII
ncbi:MAG: GNAT family N-acetyltransferase [Saprospiraceae bacterium]|nr:GNAT family N-acetyltransferase [Saprospiraceae bacterium]